MTLKPTLLTMLLIITFFSCSDESTNDDELPQENGLLLKERITDYGGGDIQTETFSYDENNNLISILDSGGYKYEYVYENNLLIRINYTEPNGSIIDYTVLEYNSNSELTSYTVFITSGNEGLRFDLTYNGDGTITEKEYSGNHDSQTSLISEDIITFNEGQILMETDTDFQATYEYDTQNGIYKNVSNIEVLNLINIDFSGYIDSAENNLLKVTENDNGTITIHEEYQYTYNSSNYPETATYYYDGDLDSTIEYIYE